MKSIESQGTFEEAINKSAPKTQEIARKLRELIAEIYSFVVEVPWPKQQVTGYGVGPKKMSEHFCYIGAHKEYVNLGFNYGADLDDPEGLLQGAGKKFRHVKILDLETLQQAGLRALIKEAVKERELALAEKD
jgi:hypothetical protein